MWWAWPLGMAAFPKAELDGRGSRSFPSLPFPSGSGSQGSLSELSAGQVATDQPKGPYGWPLAACQEEPFPAFAAGEGKPPRDLGPELSALCVCTWTLCPVPPP